MIENVN